MYTELIWLFVITGIATAQQEEATNKPQSWSTIDTPLDDDTDSATDAVSKYLGFSCPKGYRCLPVIDCFPCDYGTWKDNDGSGLCEKCPPDCTTLRKGAQSREECVPFCPAGYERSQCGQTCTKCRPGTFKPSWNGTELCTKCPEGSNPSEDTIGLTDVEQCYDDGEDPRISSTDQTMSSSTPTETITHSGISTEDWTTVSGSTSTETTSVTKTNTHSDWFTQSWTMTTEDKCHGLCPLPPPSESQLCSVPVNQLFGCLHRCRYFKDDVVAELNAARQFMHLAVNNKIVSKLNEGVGWEAIFIWFHDECPEETSTAGDTTLEEQFSTTSESTPTPDQMSPVTCSHNIDCGPGGKCYAGYCGCLTMSCSGMAYAAIPGCGFYCQCNGPNKKWLIMECPPGTLFDEAFPPTCNHADTVGNETCYRTMECETESCVMPTAAALDMCDQHMMAYTRCLRSLHANCDLHPRDVHIAQEDQITTNDVIFNEFKQRLLAHFANSADVELFYIDYIRGCFEETSTAGDTTLEEQFSTTSESTPTPDQMSPVTCSHNIDCGPGGKCYAGYCGCLTMSCSGMAYAAIPGCGFYCQCNGPNKKWLIMECPPGTLFDEAFPPTCNHADTVGNETCYRTMECETESCVMPTAAALDMCDQHMMAYTRCLRSLHANCDLHPRDVHIAQEDQITTNDVIFNEFKQRLLAHFANSADVELFYIDYIRGCFGYPMPSSNTTATATPSTSGTDATSTTTGTTTTTRTPFSTP